MASTLQNEWKTLKDVLSSMYYDNSLLRIGASGVGIAGLMEMVREMGLGDIQEDVLQFALQALFAELLRRMAGRSDPQHLSTQRAMNPLGFRPFT